MFFFRSFHVPLHERAVLLRHGLPVRALSPGRHRVFGGGWDIQLFDTGAILVKARPELRALFPDGWMTELRVGPRERAVVLRDEVPCMFLRPGVHRLFTVDSAVTFRVLSIDEPPPEMSEELLALVPGKELTTALVHAHERGLLHVQGRFQRLLPPGRHAFWNEEQARVEITLVDMRREQIAIAGQELMTRDKVSLRLTLSADFALDDPVLAAESVGSVRDTLYLALQLAAREHVGSVTLDELLEGRDRLTQYLESEVTPRAKAIGVRIERLGVKDVVLPGEMKTLLNRVIEAEKEAAANVILRREEAAATRSLANTAKMMAAEPMLLRLREIEAMEKVSAKIGQVSLFLGQDAAMGLLPRLRP